MGIFSFLFGQSGNTPSHGTAMRPADAGRNLRAMMLSTPPEKLGASPSKEVPRVYGVLMDWPIDDQIATVFSSFNGAASLYTTSTFGIIGGEGHEAVRAAAIRFVLAADRLFDSATPTTEYPYPTAGRVRFYLLTFEGVRVVDTDLAAIENGTSGHLEFFNRGQAVLTELRLVTRHADNH
jgi:hypothetical protein